MDMTGLTRLARAKREQSTREEQLRLLATKAKALADDAFNIGEHEVGKHLLEAAEYAERCWKVRKE